MSYIPNVRERYAINPYSKNNPSKELNPYWEGYMNDKDNNFFDGYDLVAEVEIANAFNNLDMIRDLDEVLDLKKVDMSVIVEAIPVEEEKVEPWRDYYSYDSDELENMTTETKLLLMLKTHILDFIEVDRNEYVVSALENMSEEEYTKRRLEEDVKKPKRE